MTGEVILVILLLAGIISAQTDCPPRELCDGLRIRSFIAGSEPKQEFLQAMRDEFCGCRIVEGSININRPGDEIYNSTDFEFLSSVEEIGDTLFIQNLNLTDNITLPNLRLIRGRNLLEFIVEPRGNPALFIHNVTGPVYLPKLTEITLGDVYIVTVSFCNHRGVLWEDILTAPGSRYEDISNDHCPSIMETTSRDCSSCEYGYCWSTIMCQTLTKNFSTCSTDCSNRRCYLNIQQNPQCCSRECAAGCTGPRDDQCIACENFNNNGTCVADCPPRQVYNPITESFATNVDFRFHSGSLCVESCPDTRFEQGTFCVSECQVGFQPMGRVCTPCPNGVCVGRRICRGLEGTNPLLPAEVTRFSDCTIVNGNLNFDFTTFSEFMDDNAPYNLSQARTFLSDIEVVLGQLAITNWGETVFDYLPNLMYIGGFEGNSSLTFRSALFVVDNNVADIPSSNVSLRQIHFPRLVEVPFGNVTLNDNPELCFIGKLEFYLASSNQVVVYNDTVNASGLPQRPYDECVSADMQCHEQCNEIYRCWGPADTDCVVCNVYLYRNGSERICVDSCDSPRLNLFLYADNSTMTCRACHEECNDSCSGPGPTDCFGRCKNFALPTADTITCVARCPISTYVNTSNNFCLPCNKVCVPNTGCTGPSNRLEEGGCNRCYFVHRDQNLHQISCLAENNDTCINGTYLNFPFDPVEPFPFPTRFCDNCHEECEPCNATIMRQCTTCNGPGPTSCSECRFALRDGICVSSCEDGEYVSARRCLMCHEECDGCKGGTELDCIACKNVRNFLDGGRTECLASGSCPANTFENMMNSTCDRCHPNCAECIGSDFENCTRCSDPPGYTIIPPEEDDPGLFGCCDENSMAVEENKTCIPRVAVAQTRSREETPVGPVIGGALGGLILIIILTLIVIFTARAVYRCYYVPIKYNEEAGQLENPLYDVSPFADMKAEDILQPPKVAPNQARLIIVPETALELGKELGKGAFGTVYKGYWQPEGDAHKYTVAIKVMNENTSAQSQTELLQEGVTMASIDHEFVVRLFCVCLGTRMMLVSEFVPFGALIDHLKKFKSDFNAKTLLTFATQIASGMKYLETIRMVHRDLAARNVLVQGPEHVKITDFGLTKILDVGETTFKSGGGKVPVRWLAPESLRHRLYTHKSDVWAYGVTVWEILTFGARPYPNKQARELLGALQSGERLEQPQTCTLDLYAVLLQCWLLDPEARPTFEELESRMNEFLSDPLRYILTVVDDRLETYANLPTNILNTGESPYESPFLLSGEASGYEMPSPLNTLTESAAAQEYDNFKENELAESENLLPKGRKDIYDPNFLKSGDYEQPLQGMDGEYGKIRDSAEAPDSAYGDLTDVSVNPTANEYLKPGDSLGHDYQNPVAPEQHEDEDGDHEYHEIDEDKGKRREDEDSNHEYHEINDKKDDGYEHPPNLDHEYHEVTDLTDKATTLDAKKIPNVEFDSLEYGVFRNDSQSALLNSNQNNNSNKNDEYMHVTDDMLLPPHKRGDSLQTGYANLSSPGSEL